MSCRFRARVRALATAMVVLSLASATVAGQSPPAATGWTPPRTPAGRPDLRGIWTNVVATPLERPRELGRREILIDEEVAALEARIAERQIDRPPEKGSAGFYNKFWFPPGGASKQSSLIVDPPDGRLPPLTPEGQKRADALAVPRVLLGTDGPEDRDLWERCLTMGVPRLPGGYNNNLQIVQTPEHVTILIEMVHEVRIIPLDPRPRISHHTSGSGWGTLGGVGKAIRWWSRRPISPTRRISEDPPRTFILSNASPASTLTRSVRVHGR